MSPQRTSLKVSYDDNQRDRTTKTDSAKSAILTNQEDW
jgi:hypothetical protein